MIQGNIESHHGKGLVGYIDILGFSHYIKKNWNSPTENPIDIIKYIKKIIDQTTYNDSIKEHDKMCSSSKIYTCRAQSISDSIIVAFGLNETVEDCDIIEGAVSLLFTIASIWRVLIERGFTLRGAIDFGEIYWDEDEIMLGPSFIIAYELEKDFAKTSRVIISTEFNSLLAKIFSAGMIIVNNDILKSLRKDIDGYIILNPHLLYYDDPIDDKNRVIELLEEMRNKTTKWSEKEKYAPILAALNTVNVPLDRNDLGKY